LRSLSVDKWVCSLEGVNDGSCLAGSDLKDWLACCAASLLLSLSV